MADNTVLNSGTGGDTIASDDIAGVKYPRSKIVLGADGSNDGDVSITNPMPVGGRAAADAALAGNPVPIAARASAAAPTDMSADNDTTIPWVLRNGSFVVNMAVGGTLVTGSAGLPVAQQGTWTVGLSAGTNTNEIVGDVAHDAAIAGNPITVGGVASAAAPTDVSADQDATRFWCLRNGSQVVNLAAGGTLITATSSSINANITNASLTVASHAVTVASGGIASGAIASGAIASGAVASGAFASGALASGSIASGAIADMIVDDAAFTPATSRVIMAGFTFDDVAPDSVNEGDAGAARMSANRNIYVQIRDNAGNERGLNIDASGYLTANINGTVTVGSHAVTVASGGIASGAIASGAVASGAFASGSIASGAIAAGAIADMIVDDAAFTPASSRVLMAGFEADESSTDSVDEGDGGAARMTLDRKLITTIQPHTKGGCSIFRSIDIDETEEEIKSTAGQVYGIHCMNLTNALLYLKFYNLTAGNCTVGTSTPVLTFPVPGNNDTDGAGFTFNLPQGIAFDTAISVAATTGIADADTGAPAANACVVNVFYM